MMHFPSFPHPKKKKKKKIYLGLYCWVPLVYLRMDTLILQCIIVRKTYQTFRSPCLSFGNSRGVRSPIRSESQGATWFRSVSSLTSSWPSGWPSSWPSSWPVMYAGLVSGCVLAPSYARLIRTPWCGVMSQQQPESFHLASTSRLPSSPHQGKTLAGSHHVRVDPLQSGL